MERTHRNAQDGAKVQSETAATATPGRQTLAEGAYGYNPFGHATDPLALEETRLDNAVAALRPDQQEEYRAILTADPRSSSDAPLDVLAARQDAIDEAAASRPLSGDDREALGAALAKLASLKATPIDDGSNPNLVQMAVTFDGTWNDRDDTVIDTNAAAVHEMFDGPKDYQQGVGTDPMMAPSTKIGLTFGLAGLVASTAWATSRGAGPLGPVSGGVSGAGLQRRIDAAYDNLVQQVNDAKRANPQAEVVLVISGFSRGATAARVFSNELERRGVPDLSSARGFGRGYSRMHETPRIGVMILFDTVASLGIPGNNINNGVDLSIPPSAENVLHLTANDEKRSMFPLSSAVDPARPDDARITEIGLPGAHGDIGGGYNNPYTSLPKQIAHQYMLDRGVHVRPLDPASMVEPDDPNLRLHDTGGRERATYPSTNR